MISITCKHCGDEFKVQFYRAKVAKFCSRKCHYNSFPPRQNTCLSCSKQFTKPHNPQRVYSFCSKKCFGGVQPKTKVSTLKCRYCESAFNAWDYEVKAGRKFCSKSCADRFKDEGKTTEAFRLRTSTKYQQWRTTVFERDNYTCVFCGQKGGKLNADHIKRFSDFPDLRLDINNGRTLCEPCHLKTDTYGNRIQSGTFSEFAKRLKCCTEL
jgi:hypothetical protein